MSSTVRPAGPDDADAVAAVHVAAWRAAYDGLLPAALLQALSVPDRAAQWRERLASPGEAQVWVAGDARVPVRGFAAVGPARDDGAPPDAAELYSLYVHPSSWSTGVGTLLMTTATAALGARWASATLWVLAGNLRARRFYAHHGWVPDGAGRCEEQDGVVLDELRYALALPTGGR